MLRPGGTDAKTESLTVVLRALGSDTVVPVTLKARERITLREADRHEIYATTPSEDADDDKIGELELKIDRFEGERVVTSKPKKEIYFHLHPEQRIVSTLLVMEGQLPSERAFISLQGYARGKRTSDEYVKLGRLDAWVAKHKFLRWMSNGLSRYSLCGDVLYDAQDFPQQGIPVKPNHTTIVMYNQDRNHVYTLRLETER